MILKKIAESLEIQRVYTNMKKLNSETVTGARNELVNRTQQQQPQQKMLQNGNVSFVCKNNTPTSTPSKPKPKQDDVNINGSIDRYFFRTDRILF